MDEQKYLTLIYSRSFSIGSFIVRLASWGSPWSHVGIVDESAGGGGVVIEATRHGVGTVYLSEFKARSTKYEVVRVACDDPRAALAFAYSQVDKPYDWTAIFAFLFKRTWNEDDSWFCAELAEASLSAGGRCRFRLDASRIMPYHSYITV